MISLPDKPAGSPDVQSRLTVEVWADVVCPFCPIGERHLDAALERFAGRDQVDVIMRSYRLAQGRPVEPIDDYLGRKYGAGRVAMIQAQVTQAAAEVGLTYRLDGTLGGDTLDAHRLLHLARATRRQKAMFNRLTRGYFSEHANLFDRSTLLRLAAEAGLKVADAAGVLESDRYIADVEADERAAHGLNIQAVPHFLIGGNESVSGGQGAQALLSALKCARAKTI